MLKGSRGVTRAQPVTHAEPHGDRRGYGGPMVQQDLRHRKTLMLEAELERFSDNTRSKGTCDAGSRGIRRACVRMLVRVEAEIEQQRQHLGTIDADGIRDESADVADRVLHSSCGVLSAEPVAIVHGDGPEAGLLSAVAQ